MADREVSQKNKVVVAAPAVTLTSVTRGQGTVETTAVATAVLTKAAVSTVAAIVQAPRPAVTVVPATAAGFDRTVATSLGK